MINYEYDTSTKFLNTIEKGHLGLLNIPQWAYDEHTNMLTQIAIGLTGAVKTTQGDEYDALTKSYYIFLHYILNIN